MLNSGNSTTALLRMRVAQAGRMAFGLGSYAVLVAITLIVIWIYTYFLQQKEEVVIGLSGLAIVTLLSLHRARQDLGFLQFYISDYHLTITTEYLLLLLPFIITALPGGHAIYWIPSIVTAGLLPLYRPRKQSRAMNFWLCFIPQTMFEWRSGMRRLIVPMVALYLGAWAGVGVPYLSLFLLWFLSVLAISFYDHNEDVAVLTDRGGTAKDFLHHKLKTHIGWVLIWFLPVLGVHLCFHWQNAAIAGIVFIGIVVLWIFAVLAKYSQYTPGYSVMKQSHFTAVIALLSVLPFGFLFPSIYALYYYGKALRNLKPYFHD